MSLITELYVPQRVLFEKTALEYPLGREIMRFCREHRLPTRFIAAHNRVTGLPGRTPQEKYTAAKQTLVVGVKRDLRFPSCRPSADFQFPLVTSCPGKCEYCYLQTTLGQRPYLRVYVNVADLLARATQLVQEKAPALTTFEVASSGDPLSIEHLTGSLRHTIDYFGTLTHGRLRFVTKFTNVDSLTTAAHQGHTRFRFSLNSDSVVRKFEHGTPPVTERIQASLKIAGAGYPLGFIIAPIMVYPDWWAEYNRLLETLAAALKPLLPLPAGLTFELIQHRFTTRAKNVILERFPGTQLDLDETNRKFKYGKYGHGKYIYPDETAREITERFTATINRLFPAAAIEYFT